MRVLRGNDIIINWVIKRDIGGVQVDENFSNSVLSVFFVDSYGKREIEHSVLGNKITIHVGGEIQNLGVAYLDAYWQDISTKVWSRAKINNVVEFVDNPESVNFEELPIDVDIVTLGFVSNTFFGGSYIANFDNYYTKEEINNLLIEIGSGGGVTDYTKLSNIPLELIGNKWVTNKILNSLYDIEIGNYVKNSTGAVIDKLGNSEVKSLIVRDNNITIGGKKFTVEDLSSLSLWKLDKDGNLYTDVNVYSNKAISAKGLSPDIGSGGGGGMDEELLWAILSNTGNEQISKTHLTDALSDYTTSKYVSDNYLKIGALNGYATETWVDNNYYSKLKIDEKLKLKLDKSEFDELFEKVNIGDIINPVFAIKFKYGAYSESFISAKGLSGNIGSGVGMDEELLWSILANTGNEQIAKNHITVALSDYITTEQVNSKLSLYYTASQTDNVITTALVPVNQRITDHINDAVKHITDDERKSWNNLIVELENHKNNKVIHITNEERIKWDKVASFFGEDIVNNAIYITNSENGNARGLYTTSFISAKGLSKDLGTGGGMDETLLWSILSNSGTEQIAKNHLTDALSGLASETWVNNKNYATERFVLDKNYAYKTDLNNYILSSKIGVANGIAPLGSDGLISSSYLPSYVDDVLEFTSLSNLPIQGETGKIYVVLDSNLTYRWTGTQYTEISKSLALGETSSTAYAGDKGKANKDAITALQNIKIIAGIGLVGGGSLINNISLALGTSGVTAGTYTKFTTDIYGRVTSGTTLIESDIPTLAISKIRELQTSLDSKLDSTIFNDLFEKVNIGTALTPKWAIKFKYGAYTDEFISAKGLSANIGGGGAFDEELLWSILGNNGTEKISKTHLPTYSYDEITGTPPAVDLSNYVTTDTPQTIQGQKTFTSPLFLNNSVIGDSANSISLYTKEFGGQGLNVRSLLVSADYSYRQYVPDQGAYFVGDVKANSFAKHGGTANQVLRADGGVETFEYSGQSGQPEWVWGAVSQFDHRVWNPANFRVANANAVGDVGLNRILAYKGTLVRNVNFDNLWEPACYFNQIGNGANNSNYQLTYSVDLVFGGDAYISQLQHGANNSSLAIRQRWDGVWSPWKTIPFENGNIESANRLRHARSIWGQPFDGTSNIEGAMFGVRSITGLANTAVDYLSQVGHYFYSYNKPTPLMSLLDGYVGISTTNPQWTFHVNGDTYTHEWFRVKHSRGLYIQDASVYYTNSANYPCISSDGNEIVFSGADDMYVNYRGDGTTGRAIPKKWYWRAGTSDSWAGMEIGNLGVNGDLGVSGDIYSNGIIKTQLIQLKGQDLVINGRRAIVGDATRLFINYSNDFPSIEIVGVSHFSGRIIVDKNRYSATASPDISLAIGDTDTGFDWVSDGIFKLKADAVDIATINSDGIVANKRIHTSAFMSAEQYVSAGRICVGYDSTVPGSMSCSNWFRSNGNTGWFSSDYGGGIHMQDSTYVRVYNAKAFAVDNTANDSIRTLGGILADGILKSTIGRLDLGLATLRYDAANKAVYFVMADGTPCGLYSDSFVSAKGLSPAIHTELTNRLDADELLISSLTEKSNSVDSEITRLKAENLKMKEQIIKLGGTL